MPSIDPDKSAGNQGRQWSSLEFGIVLAACAFVSLVVIPLGTQDSDNFGLSPRMVPSMTTAAIALLAIVGLASELVKGRKIKAPTNEGMSGVVYLLLATSLGIAAIYFFGLVVGGTVLVALASLTLGVGRLSALLGMCGAALLLLLFVEWSGL